MNRSAARSHWTTRWKSAQRSYDWIIRQVVTTTVSSCPSQASAPAIASSIRGMPSSILPFSIKAAPIWLRAHSSRSRSSTPMASCRAWRAQVSLWSGSEQQHALMSNTRPCRGSRSDSSTSRAARAIQQRRHGYQDSRGRGKRAQGQRWPPAQGQNDGGTRRMPVPGSAQTPDLTEPPQGYSKSKQYLGRLVRSRSVLECRARLLPSSPAQSFHTGLDDCGEPGLGHLAYPQSNTILPVCRRQTAGVSLRANANSDGYRGGAAVHAWLAERDAPAREPPAG